MGYLKTMAKDVFSRALGLPIDERAKLALELITSLDGPADPDAADAWDREIERRVNDFRAGKTKAVPWEQVRAEMRQHKNGKAKKRRTR